MNAMKSIFLNNLNNVVLNLVLVLVVLVGLVVVVENKIQVVSKE